MKRNVVILIILLLLIAGWTQLPESYKAMLSLQGLQAQLGALGEAKANHPWVARAVFVASYVAAAALSLPIASLLTLLGGALFGFAEGTVLVLLGATTGATFSMLASRLLLRDWVRNKLGKRGESFEKGMAQEGAFYLFAMRVVPAFPFWAVNLLSGLTPIPVRTYFVVSFLGMAPGTMAYVFAGRQFGQLDSLAGLVSPGLLAAFAALGLLPLVSRSILKRLKASKATSAYKRPKSFDFDLIIIGAGAGGLVSSYIGSAIGAKVALIEKHKMGGDCLNYGCVPSKALIHAAKVVHQAKAVSAIGSGNFYVDTQKVMERVRQVIAKITPHDSVERYTNLGVHVVQGDARLLDPWTVDVDGKRLTSRSIILATGAEPLVPALPGLDLVDWRTSDTFWDLEKLPAQVLVLGGGPIGCELAQALQRLGSQVTQIEMGPQIMGREDPEVAALIRERFEAEGIRVLTGRRAVRFEKQNGRSVLVHTDSEANNEDSVVFDTVILAVGRKARRGFGMDELGITLRANGTIEANEVLQTNFPNIYTVGDATGPMQFTHFAAHQAWYAAVNALLAPFWSFKADYSVVPRATYVDPQVARVGLSEQEAKQQNIPFECSVFNLDDLDRAIADNATHGFIKVLIVPGKDKILGVTIVGAQAAELIAEWTLAMRHGLGLKKILGTIHTYPTMAESAKYVAGVWARNHKPERALQFARRFFAWRRG